MAIAFVQCTKLLSASSNVATGTVTATAGNALLMCATGFGSASDTLTVTGGGTWTTDALDVLTSGSAIMGVAFASCLSATGGSATVTATYRSGTAAITVFVLEFSGVVSSSAYEGKGVGTTGSVATKTSPTYTNTATTVVKLAATCVDSISTSAWSTTGTGWTMPTNGDEPDSANLVAACAYKIVTASQSDTETWSRSGSDPWIAQIAAYIGVSGTTSTRTATPVTVALSSSDLRRTATPVTISLSRVGQDAYPVADNIIGSWTTQSGGTTNLYQTVDEVTADDSDYVQSALGPAGLASYRLLETQQYVQLEGQTYEQLETRTVDQLTFDLTALSTPQSGTRTLSYRYSKDAGTERIDLVVELLQGTTVVQSWTHTDIPTTWTQQDQSVTGTITNYADLHIRLTASQV